MAVRPLVNIERLTTAHVNSVDGSMTYESGVEYKANTTVSYNGSLYTANVDIEDSDSDTPDEAPDRWSLTINASDAGTSGDISALAARVSTLEETVGDDTDGLVKDVDDLQDEMTNNVMHRGVINSSAATQDIFSLLASGEEHTIYHGQTQNFYAGTSKLDALTGANRYSLTTLTRYDDSYSELRINDVSSSGCYYVGWCGAAATNIKLLKIDATNNTFSVVTITPTE